MKLFLFSFVLCILSTSCHISTPKEELVCIQLQGRNGFSETINSPEKLSLFSQTDFFSAQPYTSVLRLYRKEEKNLSILTSYHPNGLIWQFLEAQERRACGSYKEWFSNGNLKIEGTVVGGEADLSSVAQESWLFDGTCSVFDEEGCPVAMIRYANGLLQGETVYFYPSGQPKETIPYLQDKREGDVLSFWETGGLREKTAYKQDEKEGDSLGFWQNGSLCWQETFSHEKLLKGFYWDLERNLVAEVKQGYGFRAVFKENSIFSLEEISAGVQEGNVTVFYSNGSLHSTYRIENGKRHGEEIEYFYTSKGEALQPKISLQWNQDSLCGMMKTWYSSGQLQSQRELCQNKRSGPLCSWYPDGSLLCLEEYENDLLVSGQYYRKGQKEPVSRVLMGSGTAHLYDEQGRLLQKVIYVKGKPSQPD